MPRNAELMPCDEVRESADLCAPYPPCREAVVPITGARALGARRANPGGRGADTGCARGLSQPETLLRAAVQHRLLLTNARCSEWRARGVRSMLED